MEDLFKDICAGRTDREIAIDLMARESMVNRAAEMYMIKGEEEKAALMEEVNELKSMFLKFLSERTAD